MAAPVAGVLGGALLVAGAVLARSFVVAFRRIATPMSPYVAPTALVTSGVYRRTRNPGYLGMALACCGMAVVTGELWALAPLPLVLLVVDRGVVAREERCLTARFGPEYLRYKSATRRWL